MISLDDAVRRGQQELPGRLDADSLVHREPDPADGRSTLIRLSPGRRQSTQS